LVDSTGFTVQPPPRQQCCQHVIRFWDGPGRSARRVRSNLSAPPARRSVRWTRSRSEGGRSRVASVRLGARRTVAIARNDRDGHAPSLAGARIAALAGEKGKNLDTSNIRRRSDLTVRDL